MVAGKGVRGTEEKPPSSGSRVRGRRSAGTERQVIAVGDRSVNPSSNANVQNVQSSRFVCSVKTGAAEYRARNQGDRTSCRCSS